MGRAGEGARRGVWKWECVDEARRRRSYRVWQRQNRGWGAISTNRPQAAQAACANRRRAEQTYGVWVATGRKGGVDGTDTFLVSYSSRVVAVLSNLAYMVCT